MVGEISNSEMRGKNMTKGMSHSFIQGLSDCREIAESREKRKLQKKDQQIQSSECREKEVHFVPAVARVSSLIIL